MDESWRMRIGMTTNFTRRKSTEETSSDRTRRSIFGSKRSESEDPDDFSDVFGGPPRTVLSRQFSGDFTERVSFDSFYQEIFRPTDFIAPAKSHRNFPAFSTPASRGGLRRSEEFYSDIFGSDEDLRSKSKSRTKSNSSSVLSSEELSPLRPVNGEDFVFTSYAPKLRPINVPCRWNSTTMMPEKPQKKQGMPAFPSIRPSHIETQFMEKEFKEKLTSSHHFGFSRKVPSPETITTEPISNRSSKLYVGDLEVNSPSSPTSSLCQVSEPIVKTRDEVFLEEEYDDDDDDDDDDDEEEIMSSYVIEINSDHREGNNDALAIDEAIAWAKEKFQARSSEEFAETEGRQIVGNGAMQCLEVNKSNNWTPEDKRISNEDTEMELLNEDIRLWSAGKETNIRLLLSSLHHIVWWANSGWHAISLTTLIEASNVKKAYQKARLCLHPDKLQQRGATLPQKYVADKAFSILQDAWAAFISQDVLF